MTAQSGGSALAAVVLNYDGRELLDVVLPSLEAQSLPDFRTVVVDNGSSDGSVEHLRSEWPDVEVVALPQNLGVTAALNVCLRATDCELVCLLNNDLELHEHCLAELVEAMVRHPRAASAGAKLLDFSRNGVIDGAGDIFTWQGLPIRRGWGERDVGQYETARPVFGACGAVAVYRATALGQVGLFDEAYFAGYEDADWAFRAQLCGWDCRYVPSAVAWHMGSATLGGATNDGTQLRLWRNGVWLVAKNYPPSALVVEAPRLAFCQLRNLALAVRQGRLRLWGQAMDEAVRGLPAVVARRREVQRRRVRGKRELDAVIGFDR